MDILHPISMPLNDGNTVKCISVYVHPQFQFVTLHRLMSITRILLRQISFYTILLPLKKHIVVYPSIFQYGVYSLHMYPRVYTYYTIASLYSNRVWGGEFFPQPIHSYTYELVPIASECSKAGITFKLLLHLGDVMFGLIFLYSI